MKTTVADFVSSGVSSLSDLQAALQLAMQLEFSTIPPYLCAEWSIDGNNDPDDVVDNHPRSSNARNVSFCYGW